MHTPIFAYYSLIPSASHLWLYVLREVSPACAHKYFCVFLPRLSILSIPLLFCTHFPAIYSSRVFAHRNMKASHRRIATSRYKSDRTHSQYHDSFSVHQKAENRYKRKHLKKSCLQQSQSEFLNSQLASKYAIDNHYSPFRGRWDSKCWIKW